MVILLQSAISWKDCKSNLLFLDSLAVNQTKDIKLCGSRWEVCHSYFKQSDYKKRNLSQIRDGFDRAEPVNNNQTTTITVF